MGNYPLQVNRLTCIRGDRRLFTDLSFELSAGRLLRLKGRNGTGKTTLQRSLSGLFRPDAGEILWCGRSITALAEAYYREVLYIGHAVGVKLDLSAVENLRVYSSLRGIAMKENQICAALQAFGLRGFEDLPVRMLSAGQKRCIALARLLIDRARLWMLDEPFTALDAAAVDFLQDTLAAHLAGGGMAVLTTHQAVRLPDERVASITLGGAA